MVTLACLLAWPRPPAAAPRDCTSLRPGTPAAILSGCSPPERARPPAVRPAPAAAQGADPATGATPPHLRLAEAAARQLLERQGYLIDQAPVCAYVDSRTKEGVVYRFYRCWAATIAPISRLRNAPRVRWHVAIGCVQPGACWDDDWQHEWVAP